MAYFDWAASSRPDNDIVSESSEISLKYFANPSSAHKPGKESAAIILEAKKNIGKLLNVPAKKIIFTSGASESNNIIYTSFLNRQTKGKILIFEGEHPSSYNPALYLSKRGFEIKAIPSDKFGRIKVDKLARELDNNTLLISIMSVNNETGAIQPIKEISEIIRDFEKAIGRNIHFHCDCAQAFGKLLSYDFLKDIDSFSLSGHKINAPKGCGLLYCRKNIIPVYFGGGQQNNIRPGTENLLNALLISKSLDKYLFNDNDYVIRLKNRLLNGLKIIKSVYEIIPFDDYLDPSHHVPNISIFSIKNIPSEVTVRALSDKGHFCSAGSACSSGSNKLSRSLASIGINEIVASSAIRVSLSMDNTEKEIDELLEAIEEILKIYNY